MESPLDEDDLAKLEEIVLFPQRMKRFLDIALLEGDVWGEEINLTGQRSFESYLTERDRLTRATIEQRGRSYLDPALIDSVLRAISNIERELYDIICEYLFLDLGEIKNRSTHASGELFERLARARRRFVDLRDQEHSGISEMHGGYMRVIKDAVDLLARFRGTLKEIKFNIVTALIIALVGESAVLLYIFLAVLL